MIDYLAAARRCGTPNQLNSLHIDLEVDLAPVELAAIARTVDQADLPGGSRSWLKRMRSLGSDMFESPRSFVRRAVHDGLTVYADPAFPASDKALLVGFAGNAARLMLPISVFLQNLDPRSWDVVLLKKGRETGERGGRPISYFNGIAGICDDLPGIAGAVQAVVPMRHYRRVVTLGTSGGGHAALEAAFLMGASRGVCVGGSLARGHPGQPPAGPGRPEIVLVFCGSRQPDRDGAADLQRVYGGRLMPVSGVQGHNIFLPLVRSGTFADFLSNLLDAPQRPISVSRTLFRLLGRGPS